MDSNTNQTQPKNIFRDLSLWFLMLSNIAMIFFATNENWGLITILCVYWFQSITIGIFHFLRIMHLKEFSTERFLINGKPVQPTQSTKKRIAYFFLLHYGLFHVLYLIFLMIGASTKTYGNLPSTSELPYLFLTMLLFFGNHLFSYRYNKPKDTKKQKIGPLLFFPYARIIPMHLTIVFAATSVITDALPFFMVMKTLADGIMHIVDHAILRKGEVLEK